MNVLPFAKRCEIIAHLTDGNSIRATERLCGVQKKTISRLLLAVGEGCARLHDRMFRGLRCKYIQLDEQHSFVHTQTQNLKEADPKEWGEQWTFVAFCVTSRAVIAYRIGKRTAENATAFVKDVRARVDGRPVVASDGLRAYVDAVEDAWGDEVDFGQLVKTYTNDAPGGSRRGNYKGAVPVKIKGEFDERLINTSLIERQNLQSRIRMERFVRETVGFSKSLRHHRAAVALHYATYNLVTPHGTLRIPPAMEIGIIDHEWSIADLVRAALSEPVPAPPPDISPPAPLAPPPGQLPLRGMPPQLRLIQGGRK